MLYCVTDMIQFHHSDIGLSCIEYPFGDCFRPIPYKSYIFWKEHNLFLGTLVIFEWATVDMPCHFPHTEDREFTRFAPQSRLKYTEFIQFLNECALFSQNQIFSKDPLAPYVLNKEGYPEYSLITLKAHSQSIRIEHHSYQVKYKLSFIDTRGLVYTNLPILDDRYFNMSEKDLIAMKKIINKSEYVYLRLGLSREQIIDNDKGCYYQVHGIYPDKGNYHDR